MRFTPRVRPSRRGLSPAAVWRCCAPATCSTRSQGFPRRAARGQSHEAGQVEEPLRQIATNAGAEGSVVVEKVRSGKGGYGFNAQTETYEDLVKAGVIDPAKVVRSALEFAASVAGLMLTTEAIIADKPKKPSSGGGGGGGGGGMGGMGGHGWNGRHGRHGGWRLRHGLTAVSCSGPEAPDLRDGSGSGVFRSPRPSLPLPRAMLL